MWISIFQRFDTRFKQYRRTSEFFNNFVNKEKSYDKQYGNASDFYIRLDISPDRRSCTQWRPQGAQCFGTIMKMLVDSQGKLA